MSIVLPLFEPLTRDSFCEGERGYVWKQVLQTPSGTKLTRKQTPLFDDVIVLDDYLAYQAVAALLAKYGYGALEFCSDVDALQEWNEALIVTVGGPCSNQKLAQVLNLTEDCVLEVDDQYESLKHWRIVVRCGDEPREFRATDQEAYAFILKANNPRNHEGHIIAIAGDDAYSTKVAGAYLAEHCRDVAKWCGDKPFVIVLVSDRGNVESVRVAGKFVLE
jgi:hypothetical protein